MHEYHKLFCSVYPKISYKSLFFKILTISSCQPLLCNVVSAPWRAGGVKSIRILHRTCSENSCHLCELPKPSLCCVFQKSLYTLQRQRTETCRAYIQAEWREQGRSMLSAPVQRPYSSDCLLLLRSGFIFNCLNLLLDYSYPLNYLFTLQYYKLTQYLHVNGELHIVPLAGIILSNFSSRNE